MAASMRAVPVFASLTSVTDAVPVRSAVAVAVFEAEPSSPMRVPRFVVKSIFRDFCDDFGLIFADSVIRDTPSAAMDFSGDVMSRTPSTSSGPSTKSPGLWQLETAAHAKTSNGTTIRIPCTPLVRIRPASGQRHRINTRGAGLDHRTARVYAFGCSGQRE